MDPLHDRARRAAKILAQLDAYKICEGCDSIVAARVASCPSCHGYRFDADSCAVADQARALAAREQTSVTADNLL